jgi:hypothetical protein
VVIVKDIIMSKQIYYLNKGDSITISHLNNGLISVCIECNNELTTEKRSSDDEGDYKGEKLGVVNTSPQEIISLETLLGVSCLKYWIISLNDFAANEPAKFRKYKSHAACIRNWHKMRLEQGKIFSHIHPSGPGYYFRKDIDNLKPEQLKLRN